MTHALISIRDLWVTLGDHPVLQGVNAELMRGKITAVVGQNGSGKTTLLRAILKEITYTGRIEFHCGHDHRHPTPEHIGYVPQKLNIDARLPLTVADLLALALRPRALFFGISGRTRRVMVEMLQQVGAPELLLDRFVEKISGGELQRVLLALALQPQPELLLLDEPAQGIDFTYEQAFYDLIAELNRRTGVTVLLVSHDTDMVSTVVHHVLCLKDGRVACQGSPQEMPELLRQTYGHAKGHYHHHHHGEPHEQAPQRLG